MAEYDKIEELLDILAEVISQACWTQDGDLLDSMALSAYEDGLMALAEHGRVRIINHVGRRVIAQWNHQEKRDQPLCGAAIVLAGEWHPCDLIPPHNGWAHSNREIEALWHCGEGGG